MSSGSSLYNNRMTLKEVALHCLAFIGLCFIILQIKSVLTIPTKNHVGFTGELSLLGTPNGTSLKSFSSKNMVAAEDKKIVGKNSNQRERLIQTLSLPMNISHDNLRNRFLARQMLLNCRDKPKTVKNPEGVYVGNDYFQIYLIRKVASSYLADITRRFNPDKKSRFGFNGKPVLVTVRDPYTRMMSGYVDRILTNYDKFSLFKPKDVTEFWPQATPLEAEARCLSVMSFQQFAKYFIYFHTNGKEADVHFRPMSSQCNPCDVKVDYIVHLETFFEDLSYIFKTLNISANLPVGDGYLAIQRRPPRFRKVLTMPKPCQSTCSAYRNLWWSFHARGLVAKEFGFPLSEENCESTSFAKFSQSGMDAYYKSQNRFDKSSQKRQFMVELFLRLPLADRIQIRDILAKDFQLFGYDPQPVDLFPELFEGSNE